MVRHITLILAHCGNESISSLVGPYGHLSKTLHCTNEVVSVLSQNCKEKADNLNLTGNFRLQIYLHDVNFVKKRWTDALYIHVLQIPSSANCLLGLRNKEARSQFESIFEQSITKTIQNSFPHRSKLYLEIGKLSKQVKW